MEEPRHGGRAPAVAPIKAIVSPRSAPLPAADAELVENLFAEVEDEEEEYPHQVPHCPRCDAPLVEREAKKGPMPAGCSWPAAASLNVATPHPILTPAIDPHRQFAACCRPQTGAPARVPASLVCLLPAHRTQKKRRQNLSCCAVGSINLGEMRQILTMRRNFGTLCILHKVRGLTT